MRDIEKLGINRLSIGVQSFLDDELNLMNRAHNGSQAIIQCRMQKQFLKTCRLTCFLAIRILR
ncbi:MAG: hypothetical protein CM15mP83_4860 [Flavobacteriaceae bacterium]|nr:MAG: hypothetical protein CM15mP83_4860 [Flavobacteriaceae bacterium]